MKTIGNFKISIYRNYTNLLQRRNIFILIRIIYNWILLNKINFKNIYLFIYL